MSAPAERVWIVPTIYTDEVGNVHPDLQGMTTAFLELVGVMTRIGGVLQIATRRQEIAPGRIETTALVFRWRSFVPVERAQEAPPIEQDGTEAQAQAEPRPEVPDLPPTDEPIETAEPVAAS